MSMPKETKAILPEFFIAFVLPNASRSPTAEEIEEIRKQTVLFWGKQLAEAYPKPFLKLDLQVTKRIFGERNGEEKRNLGDEFNMYLEVSGEVTFNAKFRSLPSGDEVFREMVAGDSMDYLVAFVRGIKSANLFATALEVTARRVHAPTGSPGGSVVCPTFLVAFAIDQEDPDAQIPDGALPDDMMTEWTKRTHKAMEDNLRKEWPDTFERLDLETSIAEKGTNKPDDRFHLYMENEAVVAFSSDPPSPEEVFKVLMKSASTDATVYLLSMQDMEGTPFSCVTTVTIQLVGLEMPKPEELPPPPEKEEEPQDEGEGDPEDGEEEVSDLVFMNVPIFLALVVNVEPPAELPKEDELLQFKDLMVRFFYTTVKNEFPHVKYVDLKNENVKFGAGIPEERFNMCVEYDAHLQFKKDDEVPDEKMIQSLIMEVNLGSILAHVKNLEPLCFKHTTEVTMRQKSREKKDAPAVPDSAFEAAVDPPPLLMPPPPPEPVPEAVPIPIKESEKPQEKPKKVVERQKPAPAPPSPKPEPHPEPEKPKEVPKKPKKVVEKPAPPSPKPEPKPEPEIIKEKPKKPKKVVEKPAPPSPKPERPKTPPRTEKSAPPPTEPQAKVDKKEKPKKVKNKESPASPKPQEDKEPVQKVQSSHIYLALKLDTYSGPPTEDQIEQLRKNTCAYFVTRLKEEYPTTFVDLELRAEVKIFGVEETNRYVGHQDYDGMNIYIEWITAAEFKIENTPAASTSKVVGSARKSILTAGLPTPYDLTKAIVKDCDIIKYLLEYVRVIDDSDFTTAISCHLQQRIEGRDNK